MYPSIKPSYSHARVETRTRMIHNTYLKKRRVSCRSVIVIEYGMGEGKKGLAKLHYRTIGRQCHFCSQPMRSSVFAYQLRHLCDVTFHTAACSFTSLSFQQEQQRHVFVFLNASSFRLKGSREAQESKKIIPQQVPHQLTPSPRCEHHTQQFHLCCVCFVYIDSQSTLSIEHCGK